MDAQKQMPRSFPDLASHPQDWTVIDQKLWRASFRMYFEVSPNLILHYLHHMAMHTVNGYQGDISGWEYAYSSAEKGGLFVYPVADGESHNDFEVFNLAGSNAKHLPPVLAGIHTMMLAVLAMLEHATKLKLTDKQFRELRMHYYRLRDYGLLLAKETGHENDFLDLID
ncbi:hypothetical protein BTO32_15075 [Marinobacter lutaoensis]|uniref:Antirestriction protein n=1 Tax=Marinobacter lutaoensis TaxID=135739 RepID=A0A1V2DQ67_9GAMM|nr:hypothetical protein [Marinobacter lutaoensis]ONF42531.1 hypothetical protein BTO32_15075 [Marinobacter lutaoensis]